MKFKVADLLSFKKKSVKPEPGVQYHVYSLPGFDNRQTPEFLMGEDIKSTKYAVQPKTILMNKLNVGFKRVWLIDQPLDNSIASTEFIPLSVSSKDELNLQYMYYFLTSREVTEVLKKASTGTSNSHQRINADLIADLDIDLPSLREQKLIADKLAALDSKITLNQEINDNLLYIAEAIFKQKFPNIEKGQKSVKDYLLPKRGKGLLAKDAHPGNIPVIAGGLSPATKHDIANTKAPVVTISASGANAGYINIWLEPVWSSDSSFIDSTITENVYFWYILLKSRQQEIFDMQTGSAQPHIYPKHIGIMPIREISTKDIVEFNHLITPFFNTIANNLEEISTLSTIRDVLLKKMLS